QGEGGEAGSAEPGGAAAALDDITRLAARSDHLPSRGGGRLARYAPEPGGGDTGRRIGQIPPPPSLPPAGGGRPLQVAHREPDLSRPATARMLAPPPRHCRAFSSPGRPYSGPSQGERKSKSRNSCASRTGS